MNRQPGSTSDPLWFKDAIIYELHVKAFADGNADGIGDFQGLIQKLDYLQALGITCIWLLPFFPSPLRDDGYDISDYMCVHPSYGTMEDFQAFVAAAHERDLQVMIELVINHTSDQHPWFQAARNAPAGSPERNYYVWSDTDQKYRDARIIFTDTEKSNWTWDPIAKAYFWHRFFSHQPDLNFENPAVIEEVLKAMRFWLDRGVDGLRLDAIPYLLERDGTNCENLPETHSVIKRIRAEMDAGYSNRVILAEANQWPSDVRPYFGDGDECHMAFHFPVMPRIYMALRQEDRHPIVDILSQTPEIPDSCQWGLFLRNHDELTLEMVTSDERDYMYLAYSADPRTRINLGIRRRLAPLMDNNRRRIELLNSLLFSLPGTPIIYYGDEIGMGDNVYLGDRNGVRTPMQWNSDRNAGFSRANPAMLYSPVIMDPVWGYQALNVDGEESDPSSLLSWMRNMIALRKLFRVFGRGSLRFLSPSNRKILAYLRCLDGEQVLCVTNLSGYAQPVDLDLSDLAGKTPVEMIGYVEFPLITTDPYRLTLGPYGFFWLELHGAADVSQSLPTPDVDAQLLPDVKTWSALIPTLETARLPAFLPKQRWFRGKSRQIEAVRVADWAELGEAALLFLSVAYKSGDPEEYFCPLLIRESVLQDAFSDDEFCQQFLKLKDVQTSVGSIHGDFSLRSEDGATQPILRTIGEQSNSSIIYGDALVLKLFRLQEAGPNPEVEIGRHLSKSRAITKIPQLLGVVESVRNTGQHCALAVVEKFIPNQGDGWYWMAQQLEGYYAKCAGVAFFAPPNGTPPAEMEVTLEGARILGQRLAELHVALSEETEDPAFAPEDLSIEDVSSLMVVMKEEIESSLDLLKSNLSTLPDDALQTAALVLRNRKQLLDRLPLPFQRDYGKCIRVHGDFHLGQVLRTTRDFVLVDFEGEPGRPIAQRREKHSPLKDVAGMIRSFSYAAEAALMKFAADHPKESHTLKPWAKFWNDSVRNEFAHAYLQNPQLKALLPAAGEDTQSLLDAYTLEKAVYELKYELNSRPGWAWIPLAGILSVMTI